MSKDIEKVNKDAEIKEEKNAVRYRGKSSSRI